MNGFRWIEVGCAVVFVGCLLCFLLLLLWFSKQKRTRFEVTAQEPQTRFAIIIPARNESKVIEGNLCSLQNSNYPVALFDTFVIVESMEDPTVEICAKFSNTHVYLRRNFDRPGKGPALDECIKSIFENDDRYDAFLILDADNLVSKSFLSRMNDAYVLGYDAACGKRNNKDWNASVVSAASALTFTVINSVQNRSKAAFGMSVMFSGTGFYVKADVLRHLGGWPFDSLTEDYEFSNFALCNGLKTTYVDDALYYDEQPLTLWQSIVQRTRWVKGFFCVRCKYRKAKKEYEKNTPKSNDAKAMNLGTLPLLAMAIDLVCYVLLLLVWVAFAAISKNGELGGVLIRLLSTLGGIYVFIALFSVWLFHIDKKDVDITTRNKVKAVLYHPIFLVTYLVAVARTFFIKDKWEVIEHSLNNKDASEL